MALVCFRMGFFIGEVQMTKQEIKDNAPEWAGSYCIVGSRLFYLKWINRDLYETVEDGVSKFFVDTKQYEIKPL